MRRIAAYGLIALLITSSLVFFGFAPGIAERQMNRVRRPAHPPVPNAQTRALHERLFVADLHADSLLWGRDLLKRADRGHVDVPRLQDGRVALQIFDVVTKTPRKLNIERNDDKSDNVRLLAIAQGWPPATYSSLRARALYQAKRLHQMVAASGGTLRFVGDRAALEGLRDARRAGEQTIGVMLGIEGAHALDGDLAAVDALYEAGYRLIGLAHFFDNGFAGSAHGVKKGGLPEAGVALIRKLEESRIIVDLAHASTATIEDVLRIATRPVVVSHTGVRATCDSNRNLSDAQLRAIAKNGGLIGIGYWPQAVCGDDHAAIVRAIRHALGVMGEDHVALGSDFDGAVVTPFDVAALAELTQALRHAGLDDRVLAKVMGENAARFLAENLP